LTIQRARIYDLLALLTVIVVIALDQWTKALVVEHLSPPDSGYLVPVIGDYLTLYYIQNSGAAFGLFANNLALAALIVIAVGVISYFYLRMLNSGSLGYKLIFGMIIGGAAGNLIDRVRHSGYVVDFIFFRIPQIGFHFAIFNVADASISVGVFLLFVFVLFGGLNRPAEAPSSGKRDNDAEKSVAPPAKTSGTLRSTEHDAQP
jgi:signal peptidase II